MASWSAASIGEDAHGAAAGRAHVRLLWGAALAYLLFAAGYITYITFLSAYLADRHAPLGQVVVTRTALGLAVIAAPALWSHPTAQWPAPGHWRFCSPSWPAERRWYWQHPRHR